MHMGRRAWAREAAAGLELLVAGASWLAGWLAGTAAAQVPAVHIMRPRAAAMLQVPTKTSGKSYQICGVINQVDDTTLEITELPIRKWTQVGAPSAEQAWLSVAALAHGASGSSAMLGRSLCGGRLSACLLACLLEPLLHRGV